MHVFSKCDKINFQKDFLKQNKSIQIGMQLVFKYVKIMSNIKLNLKKIYLSILRN
jgi:hypothetical protein